MIKDLLRRLGSGSAEQPRSTGTASVEELQAQVCRLEEQNERLRKAMRTCIDCEYRIEVVARRDSVGAAADGGLPQSGPSGDDPGSAPNR